MKKFIILVSLVSLVACSNDDSKIQQCIEEIENLTYLERICTLPIDDAGIDVNIVDANDKSYVKHFSKQEAEKIGIHNCEEPAKYIIVINGFGNLNQKDALKISKNWDYSNFKYYNSADNIINDYEKDACKALKKLKKYIQANKSE